MIGAPGVSLAIRDALTPGDTAFDVGAYAGWFSALMARLVGPRGHVVAFEADPTNIDACCNNLRMCGLSNYSAVCAAVADHTGTAKFFANTTHKQASSLCPENPENCAEIEIPMVSLDDYTKANGLCPSFVKIDVERCEHLVLQGAAEYIAKHKPTLVLEQVPGDLRCRDFLAPLGYIGIDAADYLPFNREYPEEAAICDVIYYHPESGRYGAAPLHRELALSDNEPKTEIVDGRLVCGPFDLDPGRYVIEFDSLPAVPHAMLSQRLVADGKAMTKEDGRAEWLRRSFRRIPVHLPRPASLTLEYLPISVDAHLDMLIISDLRIYGLPALSRPPKINEL